MTNTKVQLEPHQFNSLYQKIIDKYKDEDLKNENIKSIPKYIFYGYSDNYDYASQMSIKKVMIEKYIKKFDKHDFEAKFPEGKFNGKYLYERKAEFDKSKEVIKVGSNYLAVYLCYIGINDIQQLSEKSSDEILESDEYVAHYRCYFKDSPSMKDYLFCDKESNISYFLLSIRNGEKVEILNSPSKFEFHGVLVNFETYSEIIFEAKKGDKKRKSYVILSNGNEYLVNRNLSIGVYLNMSRTMEPVYGVMVLEKILNPSFFAISNIPEVIKQYLMDKSQLRLAENNIFSLGSLKKKLDKEYLGWEKNRKKLKQLVGDYTLYAIGKDDKGKKPRLIQGLLRINNNNTINYKSVGILELEGNIKVVNYNKIVIDMNTLGSNQGGFFHIFLDGPLEGEVKFLKGVYAGISRLFELASGGVFLEKEKPLNDEDFKNYQGKYIDVLSEEYNYIITENPMIEDFFISEVSNYNDDILFQKYLHEHKK